MSQIVRHLRIEGLVQGVSYRHSMAQQAALLGVAGWVRNCRDGSVEAMLAGDEAAVLRLVDWAGHGPARARVDRVAIEIGAGEFTGFEQRPTV